MLELYDSQISLIRKCFEALTPVPVEKSVEPWPVQKTEDLILKSDMAFELGGGTGYAVSGILFTTNDQLVSESGVFCAGEDFCDCSESGVEKADGLAGDEINYARIVVVRIKDEAIHDRKNQQLYGIFRKLEYERYHSFLSGVGLRVSSVQNREVVRVSRSALEKGITLNRMALGFAECFKVLPEVEKVQVYIAASKNPAAEGVFEELKKITQKADFITNSLNEIFKGLKMDCSVCGQKSLCDEISGMKELHKATVEA